MKTFRKHTWKEIRGLLRWIIAWKSDAVRYLAFWFNFQLFQPKKHVQIYAPVAKQHLF